MSFILTVWSPKCLTWYIEVCITIMADADMDGSSSDEMSDFEDIEISDADMATMAELEHALQENANLYDKHLEVGSLAHETLWRMSSSAIIHGRQWSWSWIKIRAWIQRCRFHMHTEVATASASEDVRCMSTSQIWMWVWWIEVWLIEIEDEDIAHIAHLMVSESGFGLGDEHLSDVK